MTRQIKVKRKADGLNKPDPSKCKNLMEVIRLAHRMTLAELKWWSSVSYEQYVEIFNKKYNEIVSLIRPK